MRIGILGGSFDPPHRGHEHIAVAAGQALHLNRLYLIPAYSSPLKERHGAKPQHRTAMLELMCASLKERMKGCDISVFFGEMDRGGSSYTYVTLTEIHRLHPADRLYLIVGADVLPQFSRWKRWQVIFELAQLAVYPRPQMAEPSVLMNLPSELAEYAVSVHFMEGEPQAVSSTNLREAYAHGLSIEKLINKDVYSYIKAHFLYATKKDC